VGGGGKAELDRRRKFVEWILWEFECLGVCWLVLMTVCLSVLVLMISLCFSLDFCRSFRSSLFLSVFLSVLFRCLLPWKISSGLSLLCLKLQNCQFGDLRLKRLQLC
jgi:hypothetical protein